MTLWYATRVFGIVSFVLLSAVMTLGLLGASRRTGYGAALLHRSLSLLSVVFVALHVVAAIGDGFVPLAWKDGFVPFLSGYRPLLTGLGTVAADLLLALVVTSLLRRRLGLHAWRAVHLLAPLCWPVALVHAVAIGTDTPTPWFLFPVSASFAAVLAAGALRLSGRGRAAAPVPVEPLKERLNR
ncbi:ferric reductase-like transmembrane domain-containing protein [Actinocorallia longicatena]|uniref:Ferric oxidoreductase domain-containing protein n=1 Tax=Actinocorallia longicatena TaxID=111803 RepID=A0ABP6QDM9_9ACTN